MRLSRLPIAFRAVLLALLACAVPALPAQAGAYTFSNPNAQRTINAGIVLLDSTTSTTNPAPGPDNPDPYVFYILSRRVDLLPVGWTIKNPLASHNVSADVQKRWDARTNNPASGPGATFVTNNGGHAYQFGQNLTPGMAPYWEVSLSDASTQDLQQFDVLLVNLASGSTFNDIAKFRPSEVEKLRRFVDGGGTLLVEDNGGGNITDNTGTAGTVNAYGPLFFPLHYTSGASGTAFLPSLQYRHPILSAPYYLAQNELNALGNGFTGDVINTASPEFTPVLYDTAKDILVGANTYGAGAVVISSTGSMAAINNAVTAGSIPTAYGPNSGPYCGTNLQAAPTQDLKFLCNIISWVGGHSHEHQNSHQTGESLSALPSPVRSWNYVPPTAGNATVPGATINGNFVYSMDSAGSLHAFDLYPYEDLDGDGNPDDGSTDYSTGTSCDQVWNVQTSLTRPSAPTVAYPLRSLAIFVEGMDGTIKQYSGLTPTATPTGTSIGPAGTGSFTTTGPAPAPTYYEGRLYASEPDGSLFVKDFYTGSASAGVKVPLTAAGGGAVMPTGAPLVGALASTAASSGVGPQATDIVAMVPTDNGLYSLFLGARGEQLTGTGTTFTANHVPVPAAIDANAPYRVYSLTNALPPANGYAALEGASGPPASGTLTPSGRTFTGTPTTSPPFFADYDVDFGATNTSLTRTLVTYGVGASASTGASTGVGSTPALDRFGNAYYFASEPSATAYNVLTSFHDAHSGPRLPWRFRLPLAGEPVIADADNTNYTPLYTPGGFQFQGKPVVDTRGFVYALARNGTQTAILCFDGQAPVTTAPVGADIGGASLTQTVVGSPNSEFGTMPSPLLSSQYTQDGTGGPLTFSSFGATSGGPPSMLVPNLNEPEPISVSIPQAGNNPGGTFPLLLHTNMVWYSVLKTNVSSTNTAGKDIVITQGEGLTKVGNALFFVGGTVAGGPTNLYSVPADPQAAGYTIANKYVDASTIPPNGTSFVTNSGDTGVGATSAVASGANGALIVNGTNGVSAFLNRTTLVADSSRVMELNQDGTASWLVDSTQNSIGLGSTSLELSRPSSITELTPNDYLVADTGNNRAVRFDRAGKVVWELSRFSDTYDTVLNPDPLTKAAYGKTVPFLSASEPNTLNQPTSVQIRQSVETDGTSQYNVVHYLVSDTGNFRILDIVDVYDVNGKPIGTPHNLVWISHTHDKQQRQYRYQSAAYFSVPDTITNGVTKHSVFVAALITNQRLAQPPANPALGALGSAAQDAPGGSLVLLDYDPAKVNLTTQKNGYIATVIDHFQAYLNKPGTQNAGRFDLTTALSNAGLQSATGAATPDFTGGTPITLYIRNPRYLKAYTPASANANGPNLLLADDNGVFDLIYDKGVTGANGRPAQYFTQWGFTQADYKALANQAGPKYPVPTLPALPAAVGYDRANIPFVPQSIQRTATDTVTDAAAVQHNIGRYLVTNGYSKGNAADLNDPTAFGGEVFELDVPSVATGGPSILATDITNTLSRISNTAPLTQPTFAYRLQ